MGPCDPVASDGAVGANFQVRSQHDTRGPWTYTVGSARSLVATLRPKTATYDYSVYGPNGFFRQFSGTTAHAGLDVTARQSGSQLSLSIANAGDPVDVTVANQYGPAALSTFGLATGGQRTRVIDTSGANGWYDVVVRIAQDSAFVVRVAGQKRTIILPPSLSDYRTAGARLRDGVLEVDFEKPDDAATADDTT